MQAQCINANKNQRETVLVSLSRICLTDEMSDVTFKLPGGEKNSTIPAHKLVLAMRSPVFKAMFYGDFPQKTDVEIADIKATTFMLMLRFLYTDQVEVDGTNVCSLLYAAVKYQIAALINTCELFLKDNLTESSACSIYTQARQFSAQELEKQSLTFINDHAEGVFRNKDFCTLSKENLEEILKSNTLKIEEIDIFNAVLKWAETKLSDDKTEITSANKRKMVLPNILYSIALPCMKLDDFTNKVVPTGILTDAEQLSLFKAITMKGYTGPHNFRLKSRFSIKHAVVQLRDIFTEYDPLSISDTQNNQRSYFEFFFIKPERNIRILSVVMKLDVDINNGGGAYSKKKVLKKHRNCNAAIQKIPATCTINGKNLTGTFGENGDCIFVVDEEFPAHQESEIKCSIGQSGAIHLQRYYFQMKSDWRDYFLPNAKFVVQFSKDEGDGVSFVKSLEICA